MRKQIMTIEKWLSDVYYDEYGTQIWNRESTGDCQMVADVRGWGRIQNEFNTEEEAAIFQDNVGRFIVEAIREKIERLKRNKMKNQTAVEYLYERLQAMIPKTILYSFDKKKYFEESLAMEKEQQKETFKQSRLAKIFEKDMPPTWENFEQYYTETFEQ